MSTTGDTDLTSARQVRTGHVSRAVGGTRCTRGGEEVAQWSMGEVVVEAAQRDQALQYRKDEGGGERGEGLPAAAAAAEWAGTGMLTVPHRARSYAVPV